MLSETTNCRIQYAVSENVVFIKLAGRVSYSALSGFDFFVDKLFHWLDVGDILVDLDDATYIDSTNLGLLAVLASSIIKNRGFKPKMVSSNSVITENIETMGLDRVYLLIKDGLTVAPECLVEIPKVEQDQLQQARHILDAHKKLMELSENNRKIFHNVVEFLEKDVNQQTQNNAADQPSLF